jgi:hypothetical protein
MTRSEAITELYALFGAPHNADINLTRLNKLLDELTEFPPAQQWSAGVPPLYPKPEPGVSIKAEYEPAQPMHPEIKKMYEDYFDKCFRESSAAVPENFINALKFDTAMREWVGLTDEERDEICLGDESIARAIEAKLKEKNT